ncbi:MAG: hypothetical protein KDC92_13460 [Bacteroidetes bacterium]|nr:hypothetical protein [Bacteroidota bacterium]
MLFRFKVMLGVLLLACSPKTKPQVAVSAEKMNVVYQGLDNPLKIVAENVPCERLIVTTSDSSIATVKKMDHCDYLLRVHKRDREGIKVLVYKDDTASKNLISTENFKTFKVPKPYANLNNKTGGPISPAELRVVRRVNTTLNGFIYDGISYEALSYNYRYYKDSLQTTVSGFAENALIPTKLKQCFGDSKTGDSLIIWNVMAKASGYEKSLLPDRLAFYIRTHQDLKDHQED